MNSEKRNLFLYLNPKGFKLKTKIHLIIFSSVLFAILITILIGFSALRNILLKASLTHLEELTYLKSSEIEQKFKRTSEKLLDFSKDSKLIEVTEEFNKDFHSLKVEKPNLFYSDSLNKIRSILESYYTQEIMDRCPLTGSKITNIFPKNALTIVAQYLYIVHLNPNFPEDKRKTASFSDNSDYAQIHSRYHYFFEKICNDFGAKDLYLIDPLTGDIVYSVDKHIDFGANLYDGRLRGSAISTAFRKTLAVNVPSVSFVEYSLYAPAFDQPAAFLSVPVYSGNRLVSVMVIQLGTGFFENILYDDYLLATDGSFEYTVIGKDLLLRNNPRNFLADEKNYLHNLERHASRRETGRISLYRKNHNMALLAQYPVQSRSALLSEQNIKIKDYAGDNVLASVKRIEIFDNELFVVAKIDRTDALEPYVKLTWILILVFIILLAGVYFFGGYFAENLRNRITRLHNSLMGLYKGEQPKPLEPGYPDEIADSIMAYNDLRTRINETSEFAIEMSEGNFNHEFKLFSDSDSLGKSLNVLKIKMIHSKEEQDKRQREDEIRNWINTGIAEFNDLLRKNNHNIEALSYSLIENLVNYINANQGGIFLVEGENASEKHIRLAASYAYDRRKYNKKTIEIGEGLLGNIYLEKKSILLKDIPEDYIEIKSGLGQSLPRYLYITPLKVDEDVLGMIEIASLNEFEAHHIEFLEKVSESIAGTFVSVRLNMQTTRLLEESNRRSEEISQQEEEMRQNLEEMQATQDKQARLRQDDERRTREMQLSIDNSRRMLKNILNAIPGGYILKDQNGIILLVNKEGADYYSLPVDLVVGKTDYELLSPEIFESEHRTDLEVISKGEKQYSETREINEEKRKFKVIKRQFDIDELNQTGILTIRYRTDE